MELDTSPVSGCIHEHWTQLSSPVLQGGVRDRGRSSCLMGSLSLEKPIDVPPMDEWNRHCGVALWEI